MDDSCWLIKSATKLTINIYVPQWSAWVSCCTNLFKLAAETCWINLVLNAFVGVGFESYCVFGLSSDHVLTCWEQDIRCTVWTIIPDALFIIWEGRKARPTSNTQISILPFIHYLTVLIYLVYPSIHPSIDACIYPSVYPFRISSLSPSIHSSVHPAIYQEHQLKPTGF